MNLAELAQSETASFGAVIQIRSFPNQRFIEYSARLNARDYMLEILLLARQIMIISQ